MSYRPEPRWPIECYLDTAPPAAGVLRAYFVINGEESSADINLNVPAGSDVIVVLDGKTIYTSPASQARGMAKGLSQSTGGVIRG